MHPRSNGRTDGPGGAPARARRPARPRATATVAAAALAAAALVVAALAGLAAPAAASLYGGHNGVVRLSFTPGDSAAGDTLQAARTATAAGPEGAIVDLYAVLDGVERILYQGQQVRALGGFELKLKIEGGPAEIIAQEFPVRAWNMVQTPGHCYVGVYPELSLRDGRGVLVHWRVRFPETPRNVRFTLDPAGLYSCETLDKCPESGAQVLWAGSAVARQEELIFAAGWAPAYLNWEGTPAVTPVVGTWSWRDTGLFTVE